MGGATRASLSAVAWSVLPGQVKPLHVIDVLENPGTSHEHLRTFFSILPGLAFLLSKGGKLHQWWAGWRHNHKGLREPSLVTELFCNDVVFTQRWSKRAELHAERVNFTVHKLYLYNILKKLIPSKAQNK